MSTVSAIETATIHVSLQTFIQYAKACGVIIEAKIVPPETGDES